MRQSFIVAAAISMACAVAAAPLRSTSDASAVPGTAILAYHRFGSTVTDAMTVRTETFRRQLAYLQAKGRPIVPLRTLVGYLRGDGTTPPPGAVAITVDDGHRSVLSDMLPIVREYQAPVTLFIYPSAISHASYAMTWAELDMLQRTGLFDIQSHTYWHPNFKTEKRRLSDSAYQAFVTMQLVKPKSVIRGRLGVQADLLAWPFGIYDDDLIGMAGGAGYIAAFTLERRLVTSRDRLMALPRFLMTDSRSSRELGLPRELQ